MSIGKPRARSEDRPCGVLTLERCLFGPANRTWRRSWHPSCGAAPLPAQPLTGFFACALAFSTLLSSQGADAHHQRRFKSLPGQPYELTRTARGCQPSSGNRLTSLLVVHPAYPHIDAPVPRSELPGRVSCWPPISVPPDWLPAGPGGKTKL